MTYNSRPYGHMNKAIAALMIALLIMLTLSACGGNAQQQQQAIKNKQEFEQVVTHARSIGVPEAMLRTITDQAQQLSTTSAPLTLFNEQPATDYYTNLAQRYHMLTVQVRGLETQATQQYNFRAHNDLQNFANILAQRQSQGFVSARNFAAQLTQQQNAMSKAEHPKDYARISADAKTSTEALKMMGSANETLESFRTMIKQLKASNLDVTALEQQERQDVELFRKATRPADFTRLINQMNAQIQTATAISAQAIPYVGTAKLKQFSQDIDQMKKFGANVSKYQQQLETDRKDLANAKTLQQLMKVSAQIDSHMNAIQIPRIQSEANYLLKQYHQGVADWGKTHQHFNTFNNKSYPLNYQYMTAGLGEDLDYLVAVAETKEDYQVAIDRINEGIFHHKLMQAEFNDKTPWNQPNPADEQVMKYHKLSSGMVIVVSLLDQAMRIYQDGKMVKSYLVTTGQYNKPTPPGYFQVFNREAPTKFKSSEPKGSAFWYPDTKINYAMFFRDGGYAIHDSWWRLDYGQGSNYPHIDSGGDQFFAGDGSHGCINLPTEQAKWVYEHTGYNTPVLIY